MEYHDLLHTIVKDFHKLKEFKPWEEATEYESLLRSLLIKLIKVIGIDSPIHELYLTTNNDDIGNLELRCYGEIDGQPVSGNSILQYLDNKHVSTLQALVDILDRRATKIKGPYAAVFTGISQLFENLLHHRDQAEHILIDYVWKCLSYETRFYQGIVDNILNPDDTEKLVHYFESHLSEEDSMFSYSHDADAPLDFNINSEAFTKIYRTCLGVCNSEKSNIKLVASAVVCIYKNQEKIDHFEVIDITETLAEFCKSVLPTLFQAVNDRVLVQLLKVYDEDPQALHSHLDHLVEDFIAVGVEGVDADFPRLVKHYVHCMHNEFPTLVEKQDHEFLTTLDLLISQVLEFRDNDENVTDINGVVAEFVSLNKLLLKDNFAVPSTLLMRASTNDYYKNLQIGRITLNGWRDRLNRVLQLKQIDSGEEKLQLRYLTKWYTEAMRLQERCLVVDDFYESQLCRKAVQHWELQYQFEQLLEEIAELSTVRKFFKRWTNAYGRVSDNYAKAVSFDDDKLLTKHFNLMKGVKSLNNHSNEVALSIFKSFQEDRDSRVVQKLFSNWSSRVTVNARALSQRLKEFSSRHNDHLLGRYLSIWQYKFDLVLDANNFVHERNAQLLRHVFCNVWQKRLHLIERAYTIERDLNLNRRKSVFVKWRDSVQLDTKANRFYNRHLVSGAFNKWKLKLKSLDTQKSLQRTIVGQYFKNWILKLKYHVLMERRNTKLQEIVFNSWREKATHLASLASKSEQFHETNLKSSVIGKWNAGLTNTHHLERLADDFFKRRFLLNKWKSKLAVFDCVAITDLGDNVATKLAYGIWKERYNSRREEKLQSMLGQLDRTHSDNLKKSRVFNTWHAKLHAIKQLYDIVLPPRAAHAQSKFELWALKTAYSKQLMDTALKWEDTNNATRALRIWFERLQEVLVLDDRAEDFEVESNFKLARDIIRKWSMHYTKHTKRHQQLCEDHIAKKEHEKFRSIFELWLYKTKEVEANTTIYSNGSPLSKKSQIRRQQATPQKRISPVRGSSTPVSKGPSPTKLQETTQRLKDQKISALRERLGRARGGPSPPNKLSPIKLEFPNASTAAPRLGPPLPPRFNVADIATAKQSGRIKPMMFPVDGISNYSPMDRSKLRARNAT
ncbi:Protein SFI1 [Candida viswanathii]|uniref:Protein SFI1 n=1 Tax=Candida viswanathii TaxID=5486 RepID=A0A367YL40_9ASCO|nr:Protein SFI1 [Candida viswanathii]